MDVGDVMVYAGDGEDELRGTELTLVVAHPLNLKVIFAHTQSLDIPCPFSLSLSVCA